MLVANETWIPVHVSQGSAQDTIELDLSSVDGSPVAVRYAWGSTGAGNASPNGDDVSCCENDGQNKACVPAQCPLLAAEAGAPFGALPVDPFLAKIVGGKCECPEPQVCSG